MAGFSTHTGVSDGRQSICRDCQAANKRSSKSKPSGIYRDKVSNVRSRANHRMNVEAIYKWLSTHPCVDCGAADPVVLDFDHVYGVKRNNVSTMARGATWATIMTEIEKCEVRCANCHRRKTAVQLGWYAYFGRDHQAEADAEVRRIRAEVYGQVPFALFDDPTHQEPT